MECFERLGRPPTQSASQVLVVDQAMCSEHQNPVPLHALLITDFVLRDAQPAFCFPVENLYPVSSGVRSAYPFARCAFLCFICDETINLRRLLEGRCV